MIVFKNYSGKYYKLKISKISLDILNYHQSEILVHEILLGKLSQKSHQNIKSDFRIFLLFLGTNFESNQSGHVFKKITFMPRVLHCSLISSSVRSILKKIKIFNSNSKKKLKNWKMLNNYWLIIFLFEFNLILRFLILSLGIMIQLSLEFTLFIRKVW